MLSSRRLPAFFAALFCMFFWGFSFISTKAAITVFPPVSAGALRFALAAVFLLVQRTLLSLYRRRRAPDADAPAAEERLERRDVLPLAGAGVCGVTLYFFCENNGLAYITASEASLVTSAIPVTMILFEFIGGVIKRRRGGGEIETVPPRRWIGALISMAGVWLVAQVSLNISAGVSAGNAIAVDGKTALGYLFMAGAVVSWTAYSFLTRPLFKRHTRLFIVFWQSVFGFIAFVPFAVREIPLWRPPTLPVLLHMVFLGTCCSALAYLFYAAALDVLGLGVTALFINLIPVVTVVSGFLVLGERLVGLQWLGAAMVLLGVWFAMRVPQSPRRRT